MKFLRAFLPQVIMLGVRHLRSPLVAAFFFLVPGLAGAQLPTTKPTPEQARILLQTRPDLVQQLRERMLSSGMTPDQIRARLREEGYPENLLDAYMPGARGDSIRPTPTVLRAIQELGIADSTELANGFTTDTLGDSIGVRHPIARDSVLRLMTNPDSGFVIFGLDVFRSSTSQFQPNLAGPVDPNYRLGPGDRQVIPLSV